MQSRTLAKLQVTAIFLKQDMGINCLPKFIEICMQTPCWFPYGWAPNTCGMLYNEKEILCWNALISTSKTADGYSK